MPRSITGSICRKSLANKTTIPPINILLLRISYKVRSSASIARLCDIVHSSLMINLHCCFRTLRSLLLLTLHVGVCSHARFKGSLNIEWAVLPPLSNVAVIPEDAKFLSLCKQPIPLECLVCATWRIREKETFLSTLYTIHSFQKHFLFALSITGVQFRLLELPKQQCHNWALWSYRWTILPSVVEWLCQNQQAAYLPLKKLSFFLCVFYQHNSKTNYCRNIKFGILRLYHTDATWNFL